MKIAVAGAGYVGLSNGILLARKNQVTIFDPDEDKVNKINNRISPIRDADVERALREDEINLRAVANPADAYNGAKIVIIATPTDYIDNMGRFDVTAVEDAIISIRKHSKDAIILIKSTLPIGFTEEISVRLKDERIYFSPEFLREGKALYDNLHPSRIIIGCPKGCGQESHDNQVGRWLADLFEGCAIAAQVPKLIMGATEAEAVKLFANTYLAMRVGFFNELDSFAETGELNAKDIITGIGMDPRIGMGYNNPGFGYGGYCLPKDSKQLLASCSDVPQKLISATVEANEIRKEHVARQILEQNPKTVGVYRLTMKRDSDNFRHSAILDVMDILDREGVKVIVYEPLIGAACYGDYEVFSDLETFAMSSDIIVANRKDELIEKYDAKLYTRDLYSEES